MKVYDAEVSTRLIYRDNPWLKPVVLFCEKVFAAQGQTSYSCTGMNSFIVVGLTQMPVLFDAAQDEFFSVCPEKPNFYNGPKQ